MIESNTSFAQEGHRPGIHVVSDSSYSTISKLSFQKIQREETQQLGWDIPGGP